MHTHENQDINVDLVTDIEQNFTWTPLLTSPSHDNDLEGPEGIMDDNIEAVFAEIKQHDGEARSNLDPVIEAAEVDATKVYDFEEFEWVEKSIVPRAFEDQIQVIAAAAGAIDWDINSLLHSEGVSSV
jgi:hypothetical protein